MVRNLSRDGQAFRATELGFLVYGGPETQSALGFSLPFSFLVAAQT